MDRLNKQRRSWNMSRIKSKDTAPEILVRSTLHAMGYRFRLHYRMLPGKPDIVLPKYRVVVFVHGCFWHRHGCKFSYTPKSRVAFWEAKFNQNVKVALGPESIRQHRSEQRKTPHVMPLAELGDEIGVELDVGGHRK